MKAKNEAMPKRAVKKKVKVKPSAPGKGRDEYTPEERAEIMAYAREVCKNVMARPRPFTASITGRGGSPAFPRSIDPILSVALA